MMEIISCLNGSHGDEGIFSDKTDESRWRRTDNTGRQRGWPPKTHRSHESDK